MWVEMLLFLYILFICFVFFSVSVCQWVQMLRKTRKGHQIPWNLSYRWLWAALCVSPLQQQPSVQPTSLDLDAGDGSQEASSCGKCFHMLRCIHCTLFNFNNQVFFHGICQCSRHLLWPLALLVWKLLLPLSSLFSHGFQIIMSP